MSELNRNYLFIDNETLGVSDAGVVLSVGALHVDESCMNKSIDWLIENRTKSWKLNTTEQIQEYGRIVSKDVLAWWKEQGESAKRVLIPDSNDWEIAAFLSDFVSWTQQMGYVRGDNWLSGAILQRGTIDFPMIANLCRNVHGTEEVLYNDLHWHKVRDIRSIIDTINLGVFSSMNKWSVPANSAVDDYTDGEFRNWFDYCDHIKSEYNLVAHDAAADCVIQFESLRCIGFDTFGE